MFINSYNKRFFENSIFSLLLLSLGLFLWLYYILSISLKPALTDTLGSSIYLYILFLCINYIPTMRFKNKLDHVYIAISSLALAVLWLFSSQYIFTNIFHNDEAYVLSWKQNLFVRGFIGWIILYSFTIVSHIEEKLIQTEDAIQEEEQTQKLRKDAELFKLRQQLQPHFLFNSLNSINALIAREPQRARNMVQQLSDYLRNTIKKEDDYFISFKEEMDDLRLYLAIEQVRFGHRLHIEENVETNCEEIRVPPFLLQPLVENAIKYGLYGTIGTVIINIIVKKKDHELLFTISNPYDADAVITKGTGFGIESIKRRLYLLFARNDLLKIEQSVQPLTDKTKSELQVFTVKLTIPFTQHHK